MEENYLSEAEKIERVERLRERTNLTYEEARDALETNNWNMLEAMVYLERQGKVKAPKQESFTTEAEESEEFKKASEEYEKNAGVGDTLGKVLRACGKLIKIGCENTFRVKRNGEEVMNLPILVLIVLVCGFFWITVPLLIVGLFCHCQYSFHGKLFEGDGAGVNEACDKMSNACESIKKEFSDKK